MRRSPRRRTHRDKNLVGFMLDSVHYALPIHRVREIISPVDLAALPQPSPAVVGVADHRGQLIPVIDLRVQFHLPAGRPSRSTKWIVVGSEDRGENECAVIVDAVTDVFGAEPAERRDASSLTVGEAARMVEDVVSHGGILVFVLNVSKLIALVTGVAHRGERAPTTGVG